MSVASKNPFAILNDNETDTVDKSPAPDKSAVEAPKPNRKPASTRGGRYYQRGAPKPVISSPPAAESDPKSPTDPRKNYNRGDRGDRPPREDRGDRGGGDRGDRGDRGYRGDRGGERGERGERGEYRGRGGRGRGGGGRGRGDRDARPDRHSTTGIVDTAKKVGSGWGNSNSEYKDETNAAEDAKAGDAWGAPADAGDAWGAGEKTNADGADPWAEPAPTGDGAEAKDAKAGGDDEGRKRRKYEDEEDEGKMTLDEYKAKAAASETIPKLELRQVNEGESEVFKGAKQLTKDPDADNYFVGKQAKSSGAPRARKEAKQYLELDARFEPPSRGGRGRGRGGRGDYRGGGTGGERPNRGGRNQQQRAVNVDDTTAFPSL